MNNLTIHDQITEAEEIATLTRIWDGTITTQQGLRERIEHAIEQAEITAKKFETHHRGMRFTINELENLLEKLLKIEEDYREAQELLPFLINNPKRRTTDQFS